MIIEFGSGIVSCLILTACQVQREPQETGNYTDNLRTLALIVREHWGIG